MGILWEADGEEAEMRQLRAAAVLGMKFADFRELHGNYGQVQQEVYDAQLLPLKSTQSTEMLDMAYSVGEEQWLISSGGQRKYGSTATHTSKPERLIRYDVQEEDTLQGIALKHNVTMEQLKRANKLWTNDNLHVRRTLLVPVPLEPNSMWSDSDDGLSLASSDARSPDGRAMTSEDAPPATRSASDFLKQVDSVIASSRQNVSRMQQE